MAKLPELCEIQYGYAFDSACFTEDNTNLPLVRIRDVKRGYSETFYSGNYPSDYVIDSGSLLVGMDGEFNIARWKGGHALLNQRVCKITAKENVNEEYIRFALSKALKEIENRTAFVTVKHLSAKELNQLEIDIPNYTTQMVVAKVLTQIESIISARQQQLQKLDELVKARFVELFGDPELNPRGLPVLPWNAVFLTTTGKLDSNAMVENGRYPFFTCAKESYKIDSYAFDCEALLLAGNNAAGIYDVKHYKGKFNAYQRTYVLRLMNEKWSYILFKRQLEDKLQYLQSQSKGTNTRYLTLGILNELRFVVPPVAEQEQFATFVEQTDKSKVAVQKALDETQLLFDSLMQKYFG